MDVKEMEYNTRTKIITIQQKKGVNLDCQTIAITL